MQKDKQLWLRIENDDRQAYEKVYRFYYKKFYNYGHKFTDDESLLEDAVQETLLMVWDRRKKLHTIQHIPAFFFTSFRNLLFSKLKRNRQTLSDDTFHEEPVWRADHILISREADSIQRERLQKAMATLTARQREAIFLRFYEGLSYEDVGSVLQITTKATYKTMARSLQQLRRSLGFSSGLAVLHLLRLLTKG